MCDILYLGMGNQRNGLGTQAKAVMLLMLRP